MSDGGGDNPDGGDGEPVIEYPDPRFNLTHDIIQRGLQQLYRIPSKYYLIIDRFLTSDFTF